MYLNDVVVYSDEWTTHLDRIRALFRAISEANLTVNLAKSEFGHAEIQFLGHRIGRGTVRPLEDRVQAMKDVPRPRTRREVRRFLGMAGFYRRFVPHFADLAAPLTDLTRTSATFKWTRECTAAFEAVKQALATDPVLQAPRFDAPFVLEADASGIGIGAVLIQVNEEDGQEHPVAYFSKKLDRHQRNYGTVEKEALAVLSALRHFEVYVTSSPEPVVVRTDHNPLVLVDRMRESNQRLLRWSLQLQEYNLKMEHIQGTLNKVADTLSRA